MTVEDTVLYTVQHLCTDGPVKVFLWNLVPGKYFLLMNRYASFYSFNEKMRVT